MVTKNMTEASGPINAADNVHGLMKKLKILEEYRAKTFKSWQYSDKENCSVKKVCFEINISKRGKKDLIISCTDGSSWILLQWGRRR
jgi:hypothetical protein